MIARMQSRMHQVRVCSILKIRSLKKIGNSFRFTGQTVGDIDLRVGNTYHVMMYAGHIGYGVETEHWGHHYAARSCRLLLPLPRRHGLTTLWITCNLDNTASARTCELAGATFVEVVNLPPDTDMYQEGEQ